MPDVETFFKDPPEEKPPSRGLSSIGRRRRRERKLRAGVVAMVRARANNACEYAPLWPEVPCGWLPDRHQLEVDEIRGGSYRSTEHIDPERCRLTCPVHHDLKTESKDHALVERIEALT